MASITRIQLFILIFVFEVGSTTLFALGIGAKQDAWIVVLLSAGVGLCLLWVFTEIPKFYPHQHFGKILDHTLGKWIAKPLLLLYGLYFFSQASHNFYEFGFLINMMALPKTPLLVILYLFMGVMVYILSLGFEVFGRTAEILLPYLILFLITVFFFTFFSGEFDISSLQPVLGNGIKPIISELPHVIAFPFGEMVLFIMLWHYVADQQFIRKAAFLAVALSALLLTASLIVIISVLGPEIAANSEIPLLETILLINIADIITNLDSLAVFIMFIGGFYKTALHFYGFTLAMTWLFNGAKPKWVMNITGLLFPLFAVWRFPGFDYQRWKGAEFGIYTILVFAFLPILLLITMFLKKRKLDQS